MSIGVTEIVIISAVCLSTAGVTLSGLAIWSRYNRSAAQGPGSGVVIRCLKGRMVDADSDFLHLLTQRGWDGSITRLRDFFAFRFRGLPSDFPGDDATLDMTFVARNAADLVELHVVRRKDVLTVSLISPVGVPDVRDHVARYRKHTHWISDLVAQSSPHPIWVTDDCDEVIWANRAYLSLIRDLGHAGGDEVSILRGLDPARSLPDREQRRYQLTFSDGRPDCWVDVSTAARDGTLMHHATDVTAVVQAEAAQRTFVQTLTKTFAQLSTGLAIFDRTRRLALFNPALVDMTGLSAEYLSGRPSYLSFFDKLRDEDIMPEPRSYASWREKIFDLITAAENGRYQETWTLSSGHTYRVTGRPHPNGAVAFLVEDISAEVMLTRRFREQLDMSQTVIDSLDDAVAVFSPQGMLSYTNEAYRDLWGDPDERQTLDVSVNEVSRHWQSHSEPSPVWGDFRDFVVGFEERADWEASVQLRNGGMVDCLFRPLAGGASLAIFKSAQPARAVAYRGVG